MKSLFALIALLLVHPGFRKPETVTGPAMVLVEGGSFNMGSNQKGEGPMHKVTLKSFYIGKYEVTQSLWQSVMDSNPSFFKGCADCPVEEVTPEDIQQFITKLNALTGKHYRLPTEAEWEYAALGGNKSKGYQYSGSDSIDEVAWYKNNADNKTHPVGLKKPNELGLYDMSGNVWELCADWYNPGYYSKCPVENPLNNKKTAHRVVRGGSWRSPVERCYTKARNRNIKDHHIQNGGFRLALDL
ncbi:MAG TPA: formylglycine-generating enzyme family protein [Chitinophagales bacterium]|nr:formylglycine-generating enzyme family protein [Chitinophagales bacterium]